MGGETDTVTAIVSAILLLILVLAVADTVTAIVSAILLLISVAVADIAAVAVAVASTLILMSLCFNSSKLKFLYNSC